MTGPETREIVVPHDLSRGPLSAVRRMLVQSSIAELKELGLYDRYCSVIDPRTLAAIMDLIGPGWLPVRLAVAHYQACDDLNLSDKVIEGIGARAGNKMREALLVAGQNRAELSIDPPPWHLVGAFSRMGRRVYAGGSSQYVKLNSKTLQMENVANQLFSVPYYRVAHIGFMRAAFSSLGVRVTEVKLSTYRSDGAQIDVRLSWT
jgi:hypothetical protein